MKIIRTKTGLFENGVPQKPHIFIIRGKPRLGRSRTRWQKVECTFVLPLKIGLLQNINLKSSSHQSKNARPPISGFQIKRNQLYDRGYLPTSRTPNLKLFLGKLSPFTGNAFFGPHFAVELKTYVYIYICMNTVNK